ncbi:dihydroneopterin aldolase [Micromonospora sp. RL09-050-HVF-A]|uniref:dihydroneopterin aldolase n=1 Tax=Micromonospora sp. RL09-050-HVF-A TaxID=1703433 RepID=UPI001C5DA5E4|nr:dihydroneopterin aldolase [Micromonospora sp. RL09-050-HVF-A]MBW4704640.1 dihydroneopterin aldolase [Micromonospora sp. RL09-050-HVF-A]
MDLIEVTALRLRCIIGVRAEERRDLSDVVIDLAIGTEAQPAALVDDVAEVWNYRTATKGVIALVQESECHTIEALAEAIATHLLDDHHAPYAKVRVSKPGALRFADDVAVVIERSTR